MYGNSLDNTQKKLLICGAIKYHPNGKVESKAPDLPQHIDQNLAIVLLMDDKHYEGYLWNKLFKKSAIGASRFDETIHYCEDLLFCTQVFKNVQSISYTKEKLYHYVTRPGALTKKRLDEIKARRKVVSLVIGKAKKIAIFYYLKSYVGISRLGLRTFLRKMMKK